MRRSADFAATVRDGMRTVQPDLVMYARRAAGESAGPRMGLIIAKSVGSAVERHRVARRLRHVARGVLAELEPSERVVIRALPSSRDVESTRLDQQLRAGLRRMHRLEGNKR